MLQHLVKLNLPEAPLKLVKQKEKPHVWDPIRKKYLLLTPEEWVRQHVIHFLTGLGYPQSNMRLEGGFKLNQNLRRTDILVYKDGEPKVLVECKAPQVKLSQAALDQAVRYNMKYDAAYIFISNGLKHYCATTSAPEDSFTFLNALPLYEKL
jgi:hypothetical protein